MVSFFIASKRKRGKFEIKKLSQMKDRRNVMKKLRITLLASVLALSVMSVPAYAAEHSLDDVIGDRGNSVVQDDGAVGDNNGVPAADNNAGNQQGNTGSNAADGINDAFGFGSTGAVPNQGQVDSIKDATKLDGQNSSATKINQGISKVASIVIQVLAYAITVLLVFRVIFDLAYIAIPFLRSILANGYGGNPQAGGGGMPGQPGQPGMGMGGMGMGGMGGMGRYGGMGGMGMGGMNGMNGMGMGGMNQAQGQPGASPAFGRVQLVSNAALNAVAAEGVVGPNGRSVNAFKTYAKDMLAVLILAPAFLVLAITGSITQLGIMLGELIASGIGSIGNMI